MHTLMAEKYEAEGSRPARAIYEFTADLHGDIEWLYEIDFGRDSKVVRVAERGRWSADDSMEWTNNGAFTALDEFVCKVNTDRAAINRRIAQLRTTSTVYADT